MKRWLRDCRLVLDEATEHVFVGRASMEDPYHGLSVSLHAERRGDEFWIVKAEGAMQRVPHPGTCERSLESLGALGNLPIRPGIVKTLFSLLGGELGCSHVADLTVMLCKFLQIPMFEYMAEEADKRAVEPGHVEGAPEQKDIYDDIYEKETCAGHYYLRIRA